MRLAFLCSGLEPGRDGVGDYTRHLAAECVRRGHEVILIALNDRAASAVNAEETQATEGVLVRCMRYAATLPWAERFAAAAGEMDAFKPDWVSLQFVPYGFHPKGIPWRLARGLQNVVAGRPLQIMFHELWIGFGEDAPLKERLVGALQRRCIFGLARQLRPRVVHTSNATYVALLRGGGVDAEELPIFGNIPIVSGAALPSVFVQAGIPNHRPERLGWLVGLFFGTIHREWEPNEFIGPLMRAARRENRRVCLVSAGRLGAAGEAVWEKMARAYGVEIQFIRCGELPDAEISALMQAADFGVAVSPWALMGKSGSAAAMLDHGLPVVFTRAEGAPRQDGPLFFRCGHGVEFPQISQLARREPARRVGEICARFLASMPVP